MSKTGYASAGQIERHKKGKHNDGIPKSQKRIDKWLEMRAAQLKKKEEKRDKQ